MCGLVGYIGKPVGAVEDKVLRSLLVESTRRGTDGWGFMAYKPEAKSKGALVWKDEGDASKADLADKLNLHGATTCLLHTRQATSGTKMPKDCHPLVQDDIIVIHNGHISNHHDLRRKFNIPLSAPAVDSYIIPWLIAQEKDIMEGIESVFRHCVGSMTFMVFTPRAPLNIWAASNVRANLYQFRLHGQDYLASTRDIFRCAVGKEHTTGVSYPAFKESFDMEGVYELSPARFVQRANTAQVRQWERASWGRVHIVDKRGQGATTGYTRIPLNHAPALDAVPLTPARKDAFEREVSDIERQIHSLQQRSKGAIGTAKKPGEEDIRQEMILIQNSLKRADELTIGKRRRKRWLKRYRNLARKLVQLRGYGADDLDEEVQAKENGFVRLPDGYKGTCAFCDKPANAVYHMTDVCWDHLQTFFA